MEKICDLCGSTKKKLVKEENSYPIYKCKSCSLLYVSRTLVVKKGKIIDEYYSGEESEIESNRRRYLGVSRFLLEQINFLRPEKGRLLDVGCGYGFFLLDAQREGWDVYGTDLSNVSIDYARKENHLKNVWCVDLPELKLPKNSFNVINMTNVLEHVPYPSKTLNECYDLLMENGVLVVRVPNMIFTQFFEFFRPTLELFGVIKLNSISILASTPPIHLTGFSPKTLEKYFLRVGLETLEIKPSKLSSMASKNITYKIFEVVVKIIYTATFRKINLSPTILAVAKKIG